MRIHTIIATATALLMGAGIAYFTRSGPVMANTSRDYDDAQTFMIQWNMKRLGASIACQGICRVATADQSHGYSCQVSVMPTANPGACLTALAAACTTSCGTPPP